MHVFRVSVEIAIKIIHNLLYICHQSFIHAFPIAMIRKEKLKKKEDAKLLHEGWFFTEAFVASCVLFVYQTKINDRQVNHKIYTSFS